jgi:predicted amidophosphoribosyltransferase
MCAGCATRPSSPHLRRSRAAVYYDGPVATMVHGLKYKNQFALARPLAEMMAQAWPQWGLPTAVVCPIPLHPQRQKKPWLQPGRPPG